MATKSIRLSNGTDTLLPESAQSGNGYCKMADGTLICYGIEKTSISASTTVDISITFPVAFVSSPTIIVSKLAHVPTVFDLSTENHTTTGFTARANNSYSSALTLNMSWVAIGRWR